MAEDAIIEPAAAAIPLERDRGKGTEGHRIPLLVSRDNEGRYSAIALNLPGAGSCGDTEGEAVENAREAVRGVLEEHVESGEAVPWLDGSKGEAPPGSRLVWIAVNA